MSSYLCFPCFYKVRFLHTIHSTCSCRAADVSSWTKVEILLEAKGSDPNSRLELRSTTKGVIWFDQVSLMPMDTYKVCNLELSCRHSEKAQI